MVSQLCDLMEALQVREHRLLRDYTSSTQLIPQVVWALTITAREFYCQVCTCNQLDLTSGTPCKAMASLSTYMHMIALKMKLDLDGIPPQWITHSAQQPTLEQQTAVTKAPAPKSNKPTMSTTQTNTTTNSNTTTKSNPQWPSIFANNKTIKLLQAK